MHVAALTTVNVVGQPSSSWPLYNLSKQGKKSWPPYAERLGSMLQDKCLTWYNPVLAFNLGPGMGPGLALQPWPEDGTQHHNHWLGELSPTSMLNNLVVLIKSSSDSGLTIIVPIIKFWILHGAVHLLPSFKSWLTQLVLLKILSRDLDERE